jgi:signal transduction histidine kinase
MDEAMEMKRAKERFIDQISHEVRNPLSAMIHCTDEIISEIRQKDDHTLSEVLEAAQTIAHCTQHIKNIVDDVLTLSKLDSHLVQICPKPSMPRQAIETAIKIFKGELRASGVELTIEEDASIKDFQVDWLMLDVNRMLQILFNLVTNGIKVVKGRDHRRIVVRLRAAHCPDPPFGTIRYVIPRQQSRPVDFGPDFSTADSLFLVIAVEDTGPGFSSDEMTSLFERFAQANPKTESKYGGSGLGLFISRDLTELHHGRIGVASEPGVGSTFVFSVECKKTTPPLDVIAVPQAEIKA